MSYTSSAMISSELLRAYLDARPALDALNDGGEVLISPEFTSRKQRPRARNHLAIKHDEPMARFDRAASHRITHVAQADESDIHDFLSAYLCDRLTKKSSADGRMPCA